MIVKKLTVIAMLLAMYGPVYHVTAGPADFQAVQPAQPKQEKPESINAPGRIAAYESVEVFAQVPGELKSVMVDIGGRVKKGQVLAEIYAPALRVDLQLAKLGVGLAEERVELRKALLKEAQAEYRVAELAIAQREADLAAGKADLVRWEQEFKRMSDLAKRGVLDAAVLRETNAKFDVAKAKLQAARIAVESATADKDIRSAAIASAVAAVKIEEIQRELAQVGVEKAQILADRTRLLAPFDGVVTARHLDPGAFLAGTNTKPVVKISRTDKMRLIFAISLDDAGSVKTGMRVTALIRMSRTQEHKVVGVVARVSPAANTKTNTLRVEVDLPNPDGRLIEGMNANVKIEPAAALGN